MAQNPTALKPVGPKLKELLTRAKSDPAFRDKLLKQPADTLKAEGLRSDQVWVDFFRGLNAGNFEAEIEMRIDHLTAEALA